ncbi:hypothetical protein [Streptomyces sp. NPDC087859]|uniref:hypothetical protein n=1 Tax=Streptomyces sp. NPDC087859 TaxID=3365812 RepID=UPI00382234FA
MPSLRLGKGAGVLLLDELTFGLVTQALKFGAQLGCLGGVVRLLGHGYSLTGPASSGIVSLVVVYRISDWECAGVCPGRTSTGEFRSLNTRRAIA